MSSSWPASNISPTLRVTPALPRTTDFSPWVASTLAMPFCVAASQRSIGRSAFSMRLTVAAGRP